MLRAVVFDWGGTLTTHVDVDPATVWRQAAHCLAPGRPEPAWRTLELLERELWETVRGDARGASIATLLRAAAARLGVEVTEERIDAAVACHLGAWRSHIAHRPDAVATLRALRERGLRIGLLSNTVWPASFHDDLLTRDGLGDLIDVRHYTSELPWMKPRPEAFAAVLRALDVDDPATAVFVGDRLYDDVHGAKRAGLRAIQVVNAGLPAYDVEPDGRIDALSELVAIVDAWVA